MSLKFKEFDPNDKVDFDKFFNCVYFVIITMTTVGYGIICN